MWAHKAASQPEHKAIEHGEIRRTLSGAIADQELMFEQERFSYDLARSARAEEFREGYEQMDRQEEQIAHELDTILQTNLHRAAPRRRFMPNLPIRHPPHCIERCDAGEGFASAGEYLYPRIDTPRPSRTSIRATFSHKGEGREWRPDRFNQESWRSS